MAEIRMHVKIHVLILKDMDATSHESALIDIAPI